VTLNLPKGQIGKLVFFAARSELDNLICIVDRNGQGVLGFTDDIKGGKDGPKLDPLDEKFRAFGFEVRVIDGHSIEEIFESLSDMRNRKGKKKPLMIIANTKKGKGAAIMEDQRLWHYRVPSGDDLKSVAEEIRAEYVLKKISADQEFDAGGGIENGFHKIYYWNERCIF